MVRIMAAIGGTIVLISVVISFVKLVMTLEAGEHADAEDIPFSVTIQTPGDRGGGEALTVRA